MTRQFHNSLVHQRPLPAHILKSLFLEVALILITQGSDYKLILAVAWGNQRKEELQKMKTPLTCYRGADARLLEILISTERA